MAPPKKRKRPLVKCEVCGEKKSQGAGMASHMRSKHPPAEPPVAVAPEPQAEPLSGDRVVPAPPEHLSPQAITLWRSIVNVYDLRPDELRVLEDACREAQLIDRIDDELRMAPLVVRGSMGQPTASPLLTEIRQHRSTLAGLLKRLNLPDEVGSDSPAERSVKARAAANARWRRGVHS